MASRLRNSWEFFTDSISFLCKNPGLCIFPLLSCLSLVVLYGFYVLYTAYYFNQFIELNQHHPILLVLVFLILYLVISFVFLFFNTAFVVCIMQRMQGEKGQISQGFLLALKRIGSIFGWSVFNSTICLFLNAIARIHNMFSEALYSIFGFSWFITSSFVLPVMIAKNIGPIKAFKQAITLVGKSYKTLFSVNAIFAMVLLGVAGILKLFYSFFSSSNGVPTNILLIIILLLFLCIMLNKLVNTIFNCALYLDLQGHNVQGLKHEAINSLKQKNQ